MHAIDHAHIVIGRAMCGVYILRQWIEYYSIILALKSPCCQQDLASLLKVVRDLGVPIATHKTESTATFLYFRD